MASISTVEMAAPDGTLGPVLELADFTGYRYRMKDIIPKPGGQYTFSIYARAEANMQVIVDVLGQSFAADVTAEWTKISYTVTDAADVYIDIYPMADTPLYLYKGMLQKGAYDTDWKPNPADFKAYVDGLTYLTKKAASTNVTIGGADINVRFVKCGKVVTVTIFKRLTSDLTEEQSYANISIPTGFQPSNEQVTGGSSTTALWGRGSYKPIAIGSISIFDQSTLLIYWDTMSTTVSTSWTIGASMTWITND